MGLRLGFRQPEMAGSSQLLEGLAEIPSLSRSQVNAFGSGLKPATHTQFTPLQTATPLYSTLPQPPPQPPADLDPKTATIPTDLSPLSTTNTYIVAPQTATPNRSAADQPATAAASAVAGGPSPSLPAEAGPLQLSHDLPTNGILYLDLALDMRGLDPALLPLVPLFCT